MAQIMQTNLKIDSENSILTTAFSGTTERGDLKEFAARFIQNPQFKPGLSFLIDFRNAKIGVDINSTIVFQEFINTNRSKTGKLKWAILPGSVFNPGMVNRLIIVFEKEDILINSFDSEKAAINWLIENE